MVRIAQFALAATVLGGCAVALPQAPEVTAVGLNAAFTEPALINQFEKRATTSTKKTSSSTKKTSSSSTKKATSVVQVVSSTKTTSSIKTTTTTSSTVKSSSTSSTTTAIPSVTNAAAYTNGAANKNNANTNDGTGKAANDSYTCYSGDWTKYPPKSQWLSFSTMWNYNKQNMYNACSNLGYKTPNDNLTQLQQMYQGIQTVAEESQVDHRFILAVIVQESLGCVYVGATEAPDGSTPNPGIMQSHNGTQYDVNNSAASILQMIRDGTEGTKYGDGLVQLINQYGNIYEAARGYNSGSVNATDLNYPFKATPSYVVDIANRLTGWLYADRKTCPS